MILVLNCGSQSIKWKIFNLPRQSQKAKAGKELKLFKEGKREVFDFDNFEKTLEEEILELKNFKISKIGHRVVHGKDIFIDPVIITQETLKEIEALNNLAPLHNPFNVLGIKVCQDIFSDIPQIAVFDTEFYKSLPKIAFTYALPHKLAEKFGFRKYGFHGISHEYVAKKACEIAKKKFDKSKIITCHLGGGASITAIKNGKAIDTSMGFSPGGGIVMMTRPGDVDDEIIFEMIEDLGPEKTKEIINKESGIKGICGESEMLKVIAMTENPEEPSRRRAELALDIFVYSIQKYIGSYFAILGGCDLLVFTGAIGYHSSKIRNMVCHPTGDLSKGDKNLNILNKTKILAIKTDEELAIANKIKNLKFKNYG
ncbi:MAG: acetate/propionate family kinase [Patescibacteria group bacterium]